MNFNVTDDEFHKFMSNHVFDQTWWVCLMFDRKSNHLVRVNAATSAWNFIYIDNLWTKMGIKLSEISWNQEEKKCLSIEKFDLWFDLGQTVVKWRQFDKNEISWESILEKKNS